MNDFEKKYNKVCEKNCRKKHQWKEYYFKYYIEFPFILLVFFAETMLSFIDTTFCRWSEERAKQILDKVLPKIVFYQKEIDEYWVDYDYQWCIRKYANWLDKRFCYLYQYKIFKYLKETYQIEGYIKEEYYWYDEHYITFKKEEKN
jgi:hypothetical protein